VKRPRTFDTHYEPAKDIAKQLRDMAVTIEHRGGFARFSVNLSFWNKEWENPKETVRGAIMTSGTFVNAKAGKAMGLDQ